MLGDRCLDRARCHGHHPDAARGQFHRPAAGQGVDGGLARGVDGVGGPAAQADGRADVDDHAPAVGERGQRGLGQQHGRRQIGGQQRGDALRGVAAECRVRGDARVVDQDVQSAEAFQRGPDDPRRAVRRRDVGDQRHDPPRRPLRRPRQRFGPPSDRQHPRPRVLLGEGPRRRPPDPGPRAGDHHHPYPLRHGPVRSRRSVHARKPATLTPVSRSSAVP